MCGWMHNAYNNIIALTFLLLLPLKYISNQLILLSSYNIYPTNKYHYHQFNLLLSLSLSLTLILSLLPLWLKYSFANAADVDDTAVVDDTEYYY